VSNEVSLEMTLSQLIRILWAHRWVELATFIITLAIVITLSFLLPKQYTAVAALFIDARSPDPIAGVVLPGIASSGYMATQIDIVRSDRVAQAVVSTLKLDQRAFIRNDWLKATDGKIELNTWIGEFLQKHLGVRPAHESSVINVTFTGNTPAFAAEAANAFAQAYLAVALELKLEPARLYATWFEEQTKLVRDRLELAQKALSDYQQQAGILASDDRIDVESAKLSEMATQLTKLQAETTESQNKRNAPKANTVAEVMKSDVVNAMKIDIARLDAKLKEASGSLGPNHPQVIRMQQELLAMRTQLADEIRLVSTAIETSYQIGKQRERDLQIGIVEQKIRVLALNKQRDELNVYKRDVESAQRAFEAVSQRAAQTRLESVSNLTNVVSLSAAKPPTKPSQPKLIFNLMIAACVGSILAVGLGLLLEMLNRRVRSQEDLLFIGVPVLAVISSSQQSADKGWWQSQVKSRLWSGRKALTRG
jgi:succinoglycan biosynthesis transport protein ExoP